MRCGAARCGTARGGAMRCAAARRGAMRHDAVRHGATRCDTARHGATRCDAARHSTTRCDGAMWHDTVRRGVTRCDTVQHGATRCDTVRRGTTWHGAFSCNSVFYKKISACRLETQPVGMHRSSPRHCALPRATPRCAAPLHCASDWTADWECFFRICQTVALRMAAAQAMPMNQSSQG